MKWNPQKPCGSTRDHLEPVDCGLQRREEHAGALCVSSPWSSRDFGMTVLLWPCLWLQSWVYVTRETLVTKIGEIPLLAVKVHLVKVYAGALRDKAPWANSSEYKYKTAGWTHFPESWVTSLLIQAKVSLENWCEGSISCVLLSATAWSVAHQTPPSTGFPRQEYWNGVPLPSPPTLGRRILLPLSYLGSPRELDKGLNSLESWNTIHD